MCASSAATDVLIAALHDVRTRVRRVPDTFVDELARYIATDSQESIEDALLAFIGGDQSRRDAVVDIAGAVARQLANGDDPPLEPAPTVVWSSLVGVLDALIGSGAYAIGRPSFVGDRLLDTLRDEAMASRPNAGTSSGRVASAGGDALARVSVSRQLRDAVSAVLGVAVVPTYDALYEYDPPGSHVRPHVDGPDYPIVFHLIVQHGNAAGDAESVLITHHPGEVQPRRLRLHAGDGVVIRGRGTLHSWQALADDEQRVLAAIGFEIRSS